MIEKVLVAMMATMLTFAPIMAQTPAAPVPVRAEDVASADAIVKALYDVISGPAGQKRDWARFHSLFIPGARLIPTGVRPDGTVGHRVLTPEEYRAGSGAVLEERGFFEIETNRLSESFGNITHAFSTYESRAKADDAQPFSRGINSIQLLNDGKRWWIASVFWDAERPGLTIPPKYLPSGK